MGLAVVPPLLLITIYFTFITAPAALFIAIRYWNTPMGAVPRSRWRAVLAIIFAGAQIAGWGLIIVFIISGLRV